jgi:hypothetical protein
VGRPASPVEEAYGEMPERDGLTRAHRQSPLRPPPWLDCTQLARRFDRDDVAVLALAKTSPKWKLAIW